MNILFLRGQVPQDRNPKEICYDSIREETDMWTELVFAATHEQDRCLVLYWGGKRHVKYAPNFDVMWTPSFKGFAWGYEPDVIIARGGFKEYRKVLARYPYAYKLYYGANHSTGPDDGIKYDVILVDSTAQKAAIEDGYKKVACLLKPASHIFYPRKYTKKYDVCFVAAHAADKRKRVKWVHKTCPKEYRVFQLGNASKGRPPKGFTIKRCLKESVPKAMSKSKILIAPYTSEDSGPRVISEALACGLPVVIREDTHVHPTIEKACFRATKADFWNVVNKLLEPNSTLWPSEIYKPSVKEAAQNLRDIIGRKIW